MKALSLRQPWAWFVVNGYKDIENRSWPTRLRGRIWVHASSRQMSQAEYERFVEMCRERHIERFPAREDFETGGIVGSVEIADCVTKSPSYWFSGEYGFVLRNARRTTFKHLKGKLGFFGVASQSEPGLAEAQSRGCDYVAYHSTELMGYEYAPVPGKFRFFSRKPRTYLERAIGARVWTITGTRGPQGKMVYRLAAVYTPEEVKQTGEAYKVLGKLGHIFKPPVELNGFPWFQRLLREQTRFSFGLNRIQSDEILAGLRWLLNTKL